MPLHALPPAPDPAPMQRRRWVSNLLLVVVGSLICALLFVLQAREALGRKKGGMGAPEGRPQKGRRGGRGAAVSLLLRNDGLHANSAPATGRNPLKCAGRPPFPPPPPSPPAGSDQPPAGLAALPLRRPLPLLLRLGAHLAAQRQRDHRLHLLQRQRRTPLLALCGLQGKGLGGGTEVQPHWWQLLPRPSGLPALPSRRQVAPKLAPPCLHPRGRRPWRRQALPAADEGQL